MNWLLGLVIITTASLSHGAKIQFPEEELAQESVYPVFDTPTAVKKRNVVTEGRFEITGFAGWTLNDSMIDPLNGGGSLTYHINETHALQLYMTVFSSNVSIYAEQLKSDPTFILTKIDQVPKPSFAFMGSYQIKPYYGKISVTKQTVWNLGIYATGGVGLITFDDSDIVDTVNNVGPNSVLFSAGLGLKLYFSDRFSLNTDLRYLFYQGPNPIYKNSVPFTFNEHSVLNSIITLGLGYIL